MAWYRDTPDDAPFFDSEYVVVPRVDEPRAITGRFTGQSAAFVDGCPTRTAEPTCVFCGRSGDAVDTSKVYLHAIPLSIWRPTDRTKNGDKVANADELIFSSDMSNVAGRQRAARLAVPLYRCKKSVINSLVTVLVDDGYPEPDHLMVDHSCLAYCQCGELDGEGCDLSAEGSPQSNGSGGRCIKSRHEFFVFDDVTTEPLYRYMHCQCAGSQCDGCGVLRPKNDCDGDESDWTVLGDLRNDLGDVVLLCPECSLCDGRCHAACDMIANGAETCDCDPSDFIYTRDRGTGPQTRCGTVYCAAHKPKKSRESPGKESAAKRVAPAE